MENKISRRAFLKCAGTTALAVGTASLLGGCGPVDDAVSSVLGDNAIMMSGVGFAWVSNCGRGHCDPNDMDGTKGESYFLYAVKLSVANLAGGSVTLNHSDFTFTINGQESEVLYGDSFAKYADVSAHGSRRTTFCWTRRHPEHSAESDRSGCSAWLAGLQAQACGGSGHPVGIQIPENGADHPPERRSKEHDPYLRCRWQRQHVLLNEEFFEIQGVERR